MSSLARLAVALWPPGRRRPYEERDGRRWRTGTGIHPRTVRVAGLVRETADAITIFLEPLDRTGFDFRAGQFLTVLVSVDGVEHRRCYSFSVSPGEPPAVTSKRVPEGVVSTFLNERLAVDDTFRVLGPSGEFTTGASPGAGRRIVMLAGGSGITPIASLAGMLVRDEPDARLDVLYGNRTWRDVIFRERLDTLADRHPGLTIRHVLEQPGDGPAPAATGRLDGDTVLRLVERAPEVDLFFLCGPEPMRESVTAALVAVGVPGDRIRAERFVIADKRPVARPGRPGEIHFAGSDRIVTSTPGQTILTAGLAAGLELPYSCTMGGCGACKLRKTSGRIVMDEPHCLAANEVDEGWFLACCAYADGPVVVER